MFIIFVTLMLIPFAFAKFDESNEKSDQNYFKITQDVISVQKDETQLEQQRLSKEAEFNLKKEIKYNYLNEMWATYSSTMVMIVDLVIMFFILIFLRLFVFISFELLPMGVNKLVDSLEGWIK